MKKDIKSKTKNYLIRYKYSHADRYWSHSKMISASNIFEALSFYCNKNKLSLYSTKIPMQLKSAHRSSQQNGSQYWRVVFGSSNPEEHPYGATRYFKVTPLNEDYKTKVLNFYY